MENQNIDFLMQRTIRDLKEIARVEHVAYSGLKKKDLVERILDYRATAGSLYRKNLNELKGEAKKVGFPGYSKLRKQDLIDGLIRYKTVIKPRIKLHKRPMQGFTKDKLKKVVKNEGLKAGRTKDRMMENIAKYRISGEYNIRSKQINWIRHQDHTKPYLFEEALGRTYRSFRLKGVDNMVLEDYIELVKPHVIKLFRDNRKEMKSMKIQCIAVIKFYKESTNETYISYVNTEQFSTFRGVSLSNIVDNIYQELLEKYEIAEQKLKDSEYIFEKIISLDFGMNKLTYMRGSSYIDLPEWLANKKCCINPEK